MAALELTNEGMLHAIIEFLFGIVLCLGKWTFGRMEKRVESVEDRVSLYEKSCGECKQDNEARFASQDDLNVIRKSHADMLQHIDRRFDNLTAIIVGNMKK